ncbi:MAG TPA: polysaccharide biosynthesis protein [Candidatus Dormibacteraeota bacterium]|nr:polysaccharide biosynthesis protein [Candidatus Dormibacteraeota bacterium]
MTVAPWLVHQVRNLQRYGPGFVIEVVIFWVALEAFQQLNYGGRIITTAQSRRILVLSVAFVVLALGAAEAHFKLYRRIWKVAGIHDAIATAFAVAEAALLIFLANWALPGDDRAFRIGVPLLAAPAALMGIGIFRLLPRLLSRAPATGSRLLIVASSASHPAVKELVQSPSADWQAVAIVTTDQRQLNHTVLGVPIVGHSDDLPHLLKSVEADGVAFVLSGDSQPADKKMFDACLQAGLPLFIVPAADHWMHRQHGTRLRQLSADDLVGRTHRELEIEQARDRVAGKTVLVTGAAGSIGSELCRLLARLEPRRLVALDNNESGLFDITEELRMGSSIDVREALISITDREQLLRVFAEERPEVVFHAAAYKHVPMMEMHPAQAVVTNVIGTYNTLRCAEAGGVKSFILVSTDKAVARHSVMGCTKRLCEQMILGWRGEMTCWAVRFGNVVGSRGSVVPLFERQIEQGGPVTITHPEMTRYMMTIREAVSLVIKTLTVAKPGHVYMLDMGEPMKIVSLAEALVRARGLRPGPDIEIVYTGLRPGERLHEELLGPDEGSRPTDHPAIMEVVSPQSFSPEDLDWTVNRLEELAREGRTDDLVRTLKTAAGDHPPHARQEPRIARTREGRPVTDGP